MDTKKERKINKLFDNYGSDGDWGMLGSWQYATIGHALQFTNELIETMGREAFEKRFSIAYTKELSLQEFEARLTPIIREDIENGLKIAKDDNDPEYAESYLETQEWLNTLGRDITIEEYFDLLKDNGWDLWSAAEHPFVDLKFHSITEISMIGQAWNEFIEDEDFKIGVGLAYIMILFGTSIGTFEGFST